MHIFVSVEETYKELQHNLTQAPDYVNVRALLIGYPEDGWYMDGQGNTYPSHYENTLAIY